MKEFRVLVTSAGGIVGQGIIKSLKLANLSNRFKYFIIAADMQLESAGLFRSDNKFVIPSAKEASFKKEIVEIINKEKIQVIFVGSDEELFQLTEIKEIIEDKTEAKVIIESKELLDIARDKWKTYLFLKENSFPCPVTFMSEDKEDAYEKLCFPMIVKPRQGYGSKFLFKVKTKEEAEYAINTINEYGWNAIIQEYLEVKDNEYTSGITVTSNQEIMSSISMRKYVKAGQTYKAIINKYDNVTKLAENIALRIGCRFAVNIQSIIKDGIPKIIEINPRFSATTPLRSASGINEPDIIFKHHILKEKVVMKEYKSLLCMRYWNEVYVPITKDETIDHNNSNGIIFDYF